MGIPPRVSIVLFLSAFALLPGDSAAAFGDTLADKLSDSRFQNMGQAYISQFEIVDSKTNFEVILEDTLNEPEYWVVDFEKYDYDKDTAVDPATGDIHPENTGDCSNVMFDAPYKQENIATGYYFSDVGNFVSRNVTLLSDQTNGNIVHKRLFTSYVRGNNFTEDDSDGSPIQRRDYILSFNEDFGFFFNCTDTAGNNIWRFANTTDTIEFRTTIYFTNVRPVDPTDGTKGVSWVSSSVDLIYRLNRIAIVNFIVSSTALVKPVLDFVIIEPYFPEPGKPDAKKASIELQFQTTTESLNGELLALYNATSLNYIPRNESAESFIDMNLNYEYPAGPQQCQYVTTGKCRQIWNFRFVLDLDLEIEEDDMPIDATGTFKFLFAQYRCTDATENNPVDCVDLNVEPFTISLEVTIQTVVQVVDATKDSVTIQLVSLTGTNGEDLRSGGGRRGVNHQEEVNIVVQFIPEFLRSEFDLELTLFMVCKGDLQSSPGGCLDTSTSQRYVAYSDENFRFSHTSAEGESTHYNTSDIASDNAVQNLSTNSYDSANSVYNMAFVNTALSQERLTYTITTVFRLVEKATGRRRRAIAAADLAPQMLTTRFGGVAMSRSLVPYGPSRRRARRDVMESIALPQGHTVTMVFNGCPKNSTFDSTIYHCECDQPQETYSRETFTCLAPKSLNTDIEVVDVKEIDGNDVKEPDSGGAPSTVANRALITTVIAIFVTIGLHRSIL